jgi:penicillin-binding protein 1C
VVSGASTITQQLARTLFVRPRTLAGKWQELALALRLELSLSKLAILEAYLSRVDFGPRITGVAAASRHYFDKPAQALSLAEAATLVAVARGATRYDPERSPERLRRRRDYVLGRMLVLGSAEREAVVRAARAPVTLHAGYVLPGAFHFVRAVARGKLGGAGTARGALDSTLDGDLQSEVEAAVRGFGARFAAQRASAAAVVVVANEAAEVLAYVGSPDYASRQALGQNDGALALRQPGSTLKPFVYALGMRELGLHVSSVLPDLERRFTSADGSYLPHNYDRRFHGPVRLGPALAASLNVPAVTVAERLGSQRVVDFLRSLGFGHLETSGRDYGPAIALGVAEVQLVELAAAYSSLARGGEYLPLRFLEANPVPKPRRVLSPALSQQITAILSDPRERAATFGREGPLELDFPVAAKTGTSKGNRDNWVVGFTPEVTVAVWVGNFDGSPMLRSSGATGAGPLFHAVMLAAVRALPPKPARAGNAVPLAARSRVVCALSGELAGPHCPHHLPEQFWTRGVPAEPCSWHRRSCADAGCSSVEVVPERYSAWAHATGRQPAPEAQRAAAAALHGDGASPEVVFPKPSARFILDGNLNSEQQQIILSAQAAVGSRLVFEMDGKQVCEVDVPFKCPWQLRRGGHELEVRNEQGQGSTVRFAVD